jgi:hypothetical protein
VEKMTSEKLNGLEFMKNILEGHISPGGISEIMDMQVT